MCRVTHIQTCKVKGNLGEELYYLPLTLYMSDRELEQPSLNPLEKSTLVPFILMAANELTGARIFEYILDELFWMTLSRWNYWVKGLKAFDPVKVSGECVIFPFMQGEEVACHCFMEAVRSHSTLLTVEDNALFDPEQWHFGAGSLSWFPVCHVNRGGCATGETLSLGTPSLLKGRESTPTPGPTGRYSIFQGCVLEKTAENKGAVRALPTKYAETRETHRKQSLGS